MYLYSKLEAFKKEIHIALIGCGKFITMFLAQLNNLNNIKVNTIVDLDISKAKKLLGWTPQISFNRGIEKTIKYYRQNETR